MIPAQPVPKSPPSISAQAVPKSGPSLCKQGKRRVSARCWRRPALVIGIILLAVALPPRLGPPCPFRCGPTVGRGHRLCPPLTYSEQPFAQGPVEETWTRADGHHVGSPPAWAQAVAAGESSRKGLPLVLGQPLFRRVDLHVHQPMYPAVGPATHRKIEEVPRGARVNRCVKAFRRHPSDSFASTRVRRPQSVRSGTRPSSGAGH